MSENGPGRPRSVSSTDVKESLICDSCGKGYASMSGLRYHMKSCCPEKMEACPECDRLYMNKTGVKQHASKQHALDLSTVEKECPHCNDVFECKDYAEKEYCSNKCANNARAEAYAEKRIDVECIYCGDVISLPPCFADGRKYCSQSCRSLDLCEKGIINQSNREIHVCKYCGDEYDVVPAESENTRFCSRSCHGKWKTGSRNPNWRGGEVGYYGPNWIEQRRQARIRDQSRCQICGATPLDTGEEMTVHHIEKMRQFKAKYDAPDWYEKGNRLDNLMCVCRGCHAIAERMSPLRPT